MIRRSTEPSTFREISRYFAFHLQLAPQVDVGEAHAQDTPHPLQVTRELTNIVFDVRVGDSIAWWQSHSRPNMPWAENHFQERTSGNPLNPPPSHVDWPYAQAGNEQHISEYAQQFSHTYPERFWPRMANVEGHTVEGRQVYVPHAGIRYLYGDLQDVVELLSRNLNTRQAYLPVWFPEDLTAARMRHRVPCTLGYHFMYRGGKLHCTYFMRACDFVRFFNDDVYMAGRLLQWVAEQINVQAGDLTMHIVSLHCFEGDLPKLKRDYGL